MADRRNKKAARKERGRKDIRVKLSEDDATDRALRELSKILIDVAMSNKKHADTELDEESEKEEAHE